MNEEELETALEQIVRSTWTHSDSAHDISHIRRVRRNALTIGDEESPQGNRRVLLAAVWLHDLIQIEKNDPRRIQASALAASAAADRLAGWDWPMDEQNAVAHAIEAHSYSAGIEPRTLEAKILRDADRLDAIGAIGIARTFSISGRLGRALYNDIDPQGVHRELDDHAFALDHFYVKLLKLGDGMLTKTGATLAQQRIEYMQGFVAQFLGEVGL